MPKDHPSDVLPLETVALRLHPRDQVAIAKVDLAEGARLRVDAEDQPLTLAQPIPSGHKICLCEIDAGQPVRRYGQIIGLAQHPIAPGEHVHVHNLGVGDVARDPAFGADVEPLAPVPPGQRRTFRGYRRADGRVGTRNDLAVIATVGCAAHAARQIARHFSPERLAPYPHVDGVIPLIHHLGCPVEQPTLRRTLAGMARHPNVGAYLLVGLGCETNSVSALKKAHALDGPGLVIQELGGIRRTVQAGVAAIEALLPAVDAARRTAQPLSGLSLALQCGGSDAWSGVTANPLVGQVADEVVRQGGTVVLAETPEIYGAEHLLTRRAISRAVGEKLLALVDWWGEYAGRMGVQLDDNRSLGNQAGGLSTIYEKSLGAVAKAGSSPLTGVYEYAEPVQSRGFVFMNSPGYDPVAVTGQVAGGCNLVLFTTGRGSVLGGKPAPSIKISTNSATYQRMQDDMDLDAGRVLQEADMAQVATELLDLVVAVASGQPSKSEAQGVGETDFSPWNLEGTL